MYNDLKGKRVLVQGASSGMGFAIAKAYIDAGAIVGISSSNEAKITDAAKKIQATPFVCDSFKEGSGTALVWQFIEKFKGLDILVTNTGNPPKAPFMDTKLDDWRKGFQSLFMNVVEATLETLPPMKEQKFGRIILMTSAAAKEPISSMTISSSIRAGLLGLMKTLSHECAEQGITINSILPGYVETQMLKDRMKDLPGLAKTMPAKRLGSPEEIAALALFLGSKGASYITGQAIACDGGLLRGL